MRPIVGLYGSILRQHCVVNEQPATSGQSVATGPVALATCSQRGFTTSSQRFNKATGRRREQRPYGVHCEIAELVTHTARACGL